MIRPLERYVALALQEMAGIARALPEDLPGFIRTLTFCDALDQLVIFGGDAAPSGFLAWLCYEPQHLALFKDRDFEGVSRLPRDELTRGPYLYVTEAWTRIPRLAYLAIRELGRLPGVEALSAHTRLASDPMARRWRFRRVHRERMTL